MRETYSLQTPFGREEVDTPLQRTLDKVKMALRVTTDAFDDELKGLIQAAESDLLVAGVALPTGVRHADGVSVRRNESPSQRDPLILRAIITYCKLYFGEPDPQTYDRLKAAYDEQKAQLSMATGYVREGA